ncbi:polyprenyl synthetase family protein [Micrococcus porci]|uniref:polyprenyl synthetase family protein n=1 Tax=Micrococcus TaxID=1269 RepID=UPI001CC9C377|nr:MULTISPECIES: polyprenyl synthetase family protein [Micrococcus]MCG7423516.1 polyprenyl synthetase family protein [Micrococcus sp. ACRRV]UBH23679.1 polyprenyl synthetase family protein [Micrococcus porci]
MPTPETASVSDFRAAVAERLTAVLDGHARGAARIHPDADPVVEAVSVLTSGGKRLRAVLCWLGWRAAGGSPTDPRAAVAGAAFELFQAAALIHDDILDRSDTRRGMPSVHRRFEARHREHGWRHEAEHFGVSAAILAGDVALALSDSMFSRAIEGTPRAERARREMERMRFEVMVGQYLDVAAEMAPPAADPAAAERAARAVVEHKSARYSAVHPLALGALLAGADDDLVAAFEAVSLPFGMAFQLQDDLLGVFGDPAHTGKPAGDDLREGKRTVLVARAEALLPRGEAAALDAELGDPALSAERVAHWQRRLEEVGARTAVADEVDRLSAEARRGLERLAALGVGTDVRGELAELIDAYTVRTA